MWMYCMYESMEKAESWTNIPSCLSFLRYVLRKHQRPWYKCLARDFKSFPLICFHWISFTNIIGLILVPCLHSYLKNQSPPERQVNGSNSDAWHIKCSNFFSEMLEVLVKKIFWQSGLNQCGFISFLWSRIRMWVLGFMNWLACIWFLRDFQQFRVNNLFGLNFDFYFSGLWLSCIVLFLSRACVYYVWHI